MTGLSLTIPRQAHNLSRQPKGMKIARALDQTSEDSVHLVGFDQPEKACHWGDRPLGARHGSHRGRTTQLARK